MPRIELVTGDIAVQRVDAIVNAANSSSPRGTLPSPSGDGPRHRRGIRRLSGRAFGHVPGDVTASQSSSSLGSSVMMPSTPRALTSAQCSWLLSV